MLDHHVNIFNPIINEVAVTLFLGRQLRKVLLNQNIGFIYVRQLDLEICAANFLRFAILGENHRSFLDHALIVFEFTCRP